MSGTTPYRSAGMPRRGDGPGVPTGRAPVPPQARSAPAAPGRSAPGRSAPDGTAPDRSADLRYDRSPASAPGRAAARGAGPTVTRAPGRPAADRPGGLVRRASGQGSTAVVGRGATRRSGPRDRGLPLTPAVALVAVLAVFGDGVDAVSGPGLRTLFAVCLVLGSLAAVALVRPRHLRAVVATPPLVYAALVVVTVSRSGAQSSLTRRAMQVFTEMVVSAPGMLLATVLALAVALTRGAFLRAGDRRAATRSPSAARPGQPAAAYRS